MRGAWCVRRIYGNDNDFRTDSPRITYHASRIPFQPMIIKFGTSGWRGLIARDFTFENVRLATQGIALYLRAELEYPRSAIYGRKPVVILGYDTRFLGREFSLAAAEVLTQAQLTPLPCNRD